MGVRHTDLGRKATTVIVEEASALLYNTAVWCTWYMSVSVWVCGCVGGWVCDLWWDEECDGLNKRV